MADATNSSMLLTLVMLYMLVSVVFFGSLAFIARRPIPAMESADRIQEDNLTAPATPARQPRHAEEFAEQAA